MVETLTWSYLYSLAHAVLNYPPCSCDGQIHDPFSPSTQHEFFFLFSREGFNFLKIFSNLRQDQLHLHDEPKVGY